MIYLHYFENESAFTESYYGSGYSEPWVSYIDNADKVDYNKTKDEKLLGMPFTVEALGSGNITWNLSSYAMQYSKNGGEWTSMTGEASIPVVSGDEVAFKGTGTWRANTNGPTFGGACKIKGNTMSLFYGDNFMTASTLPSDACFSSFFLNMNGLVSAEDLKLPAMTLRSGCYNSMFKGCTSLTTAPELPATTLADLCYREMFKGCTSLTTAPELPATTLTQHCYREMFNGCTSLTTAPELPATTLASNCYYGMFQGCTGLTVVQEELPATTLENSCYYLMFKGCTSLTTAPKLPAITLTNNCYNSMFSGCTSLNYIKAMFTTNPGASYTSSWVSGVAANGKFVKNSAATWTTTGSSGVPTGWTVETASE